MANENTVKIIDIEDTILNYKQGHVSAKSCLVKIMDIIASDGFDGMFADEDGYRYVDVDDIFENPDGEPLYNITRV